VSQANDGHEALKIIIASKNKSGSVDLLVSDIQTPGLTGTELIAEFQRLNISLSVLVITNYQAKDTAIGLKGKGCVEFIEKPFSAEDLLERVSHFFGKD